MKNILKIIFSIVVVGVFSWFFLNPVRLLGIELYNRYFPCRYPISYTLGTFDKNFGISEGDFLEAIKEAERVWEQPINKELFVYKPDSLSNYLKINLTYDFRQQVTEKINKIDASLLGTRAEYDHLKSQYAILQTEYSAQKKEYESLVALFQKKQSAYTKKVNYWNGRGGADAKTYKEIKNEEVSLQNDFEKVKVMERELDLKISDINTLVSQINNLAKELNLNVGELNSINQSRGEEFTQGEYKEGAQYKEINVYEFSTKEKLISVLAHEFGHALGLEHVEDSGAIMYYLNENKNGKATPADLDALKMRCKIK